MRFEAHQRKKQRELAGVYFYFLFCTFNLDKDMALPFLDVFVTFDVLVFLNHIHFH